MRKFCYKFCMCLIFCAMSVFMIAIDGLGYGDGLNPLTLTIYMVPAFFGFMFIFVGNPE